MSIDLLKSFHNKERGDEVIYKNIKKLCEKEGMSISQLERNSGLSNGAITKWKTVNPTIDNLKSVAKALDVPIEELLKE